MFLMMLTTVFSYISALFNKKVIRQENQKPEEQKKAQELENVIQKITQMSKSENAKTVWQSLWTLISENTSVLTTVKFEHISEIFDMSMNKTKYFQQRIDFLKEKKRKYMQFEWGDYKEFKNLVAALKEEKISEVLGEFAKIAIDSVSQCREKENCKQEERIGDFVGLITGLEPSKVKKITGKTYEAIDNVFNLFGLHNFW